VSTERRFTPEEANALLPTLREALPRVKEARQVILDGGERIRRSASRNGGGRVGKEYMEALSTLRREVEALAAEGIVLRDPETGLVDFPSERDGREVFLCWRLGEGDVAFWHGPEGGFAGRKPV
jgi:hypothetical protein